MKVEQEVLRVLDETLSLNGGSAAFSRSTPLLGAQPGLDSMTVVSILSALEERMGLVIKDEEIDTSISHQAKNSWQWCVCLGHRSLYNDRRPR